MKKAVSLLLAAAMTTGLAACGSTASESTAQTSSAAQSTAESSAAEAEGTVYQIGICQQQPHEALDQATQGFKDALVEAFGKEGVTFDEQNAQGDSNTCSTIINGFVSSSYDLIMANGTSALQAAAAGTADIPILGTSITEYGRGPGHRRL